MAEHKDRLDRASVVVLVIGFEDPQRLAWVKQRIESPFRFVVDEERIAYEAFGMGRASWPRTYLHPRVVGGYARMLVGGKKPDLRLGQDRRQLGGDVVLDRDGRIVLSHPESGPEDRSAVGRIVAATLGRD
jgi:hypothetical protein